jgi:hypothetical protein
LRGFPLCDLVASYLYRVAMGNVFAEMTTLKATKVAGLIHSSADAVVSHARTSREVHNIFKTSANH